MRSAWSSVWAFETAPVPSPVEGPPLAPRDGASDVASEPSVLFRWSAVAGATSYRWRLATSRGMSAGSVVALRNGLSTAQHEQAGLVPGEPYYWQVSSCTGSGCSAWSQPVWRFETGSGAEPVAAVRRCYTSVFGNGWPWGYVNAG